MELHVRTTGMCLIVPELANSVVQRYHLLLPATHHPHLHAAILTHNNAGQGYDLANSYLDLTGIGADRGGADLSNVVDLQELVGKPVAAKQVGNEPDASVSARVTLPVPSWTFPGETASWQPYRDGGAARPVFASTHHLTWVYENVDPQSLVLLRRQLREGGAADTTPLPNPNPEDGVMCFSITHLPAAGSHVPIGQFSPHFPMYAHVVDMGKRPGMKLKRKPAVTPAAILCANTREPLVPFSAEAAYNCMLARSGMG